MKKTSRDLLEEYRKQAQERILGEFGEIETVQFAVLKDNYFFADTTTDCAHCGHEYEEQEEFTIAVAKELRDFLTAMINELEGMNE